MERRKNLNDKFGFVDSMKIKDFIDYEQPNEYIVESDRYSNGCSTPVLTAGQSFILGYTNESKGIYKKGPCIIFDDFTTSVHYVDFPFKVKSSAMKILTTKSNADIKYCYYLLLSLSKMPPNHKRQWISTTSEKSYVLPSMDKQISIVKQLDLISDTIANYTNQIENLDNLVKARFIEMFGDPIRNPYGWYNDCLNNVCTKINDGTHCSPESFDKGDYMYITAKNIKQNGLDLSNVTYVSEKVHKPIYQRCNPEFGDILYIKDGATTGIATINTMKNEFTLLSSVALLKYDRSLINGYYLIHLLNSKEMYSKIRKNMGGAAITRLTIAKIKEIKVIVPPIDLQNQFADFVRQVDKSREEVKKSLEKTQQLYDSLMQEYFG